MKKVSELFVIRYGNSLELNRLTVTNSDNGIAFVSRKSGDNGISAYVELIPDVTPNPAGELTCALSGNGVLSTFVQNRPYYTAYHVACMRPRRSFSVAELLYYCECIRRNRYRYSWGRQANRSLKDILIPDPEDIPAWVYGVDVEPFEDAARPADGATVLLPNVAEWQPFRLADLFDIRKGKRLTKANMTPGETPFIGSVERNNGITAFVGQSPIHSGNTITVNYNGSVAEAFYQSDPFWACDDVNVLYPKFALTPQLALFIITVIRREKYRFNYGRKWHLKRMGQAEIRLPADTNRQPDWGLMAAYIRALPFSSNTDGVA